MINENLTMNHFQIETEMETYVIMNFITNSFSITIVLLSKVVIISDFLKAIPVSKPYTYVHIRIYKICFQSRLN